MFQTRREHHIAFRTRNSTYVFRWVPGARWGWLSCLTGTFAGQTFEVRTEDVRDLAWPGERLFAQQRDGGEYVTSRITERTSAYEGFGVRQSA